MRGLVWFRNDLRVRDNAALHAALAEADELVCLFCMDDRWQRPNRFGARSLGIYRMRFLRESLAALDHELAGLGLRLHVVSGKPAEQVAAAVDLHGIDTVYHARSCGAFEREDARRVRDARPQVRFLAFDSETLFTREQVAALPDRFPGTFSAFRRQVGDWPVPAVTGPVRAAATAPEHGSDKLLRAHDLPPVEIEFGGGEWRGLRHLQAYFAGEGALHYRETRNALDDEAASTRFSPWLANGCLSPRQVLTALRRFEAVHGANDSTCWIWFELLWREFFHWHAHAHGDRLYAFAGTARVRPQTTFYPHRFRAWRDGRTPWPLVNACMRRLNSTGYLSNRGRQIAASCLVNELQLDWRCGAAWFEQQLIDYDVASNWGNWQYIAGVGADPRGGRHFDIGKQTRDFDPEGAFIARWTADTDPDVPMDVVDAADWPLTAPAHSGTNTSGGFR